MQVQQQAAELDAVGAQVMVVTFEDARRVQAFAQRERLGFQFLIDEDRLLYQAFHLVQGHGRDFYNVAYGHQLPERPDSPALAPHSSRRHQPARGRRCVGCPGTRGVGASQHDTG